MADIEKQRTEDSTANEGRQLHDRLPDHNKDLARTRTQIDVIETTTQNPYKELNFIGTYIAIAVACTGAFASNIMPVTAIIEINAILGPSPSYVWVALAWTLMSSVGFPLVGRLSDIFGESTTPIVQH